MKTEDLIVWEYAWRVSVLLGYHSLHFRDAANKT
jgi:hypothetical protein